MIKPIAFYLPQYHPIPENDQWWGKGFTEWTNVTKAKPLFKGHWQPRLPADLGFYDLRLSEIREAQANLARENGIYGFCYYHYWFDNNKCLLEKPIHDVLKLQRPNFPFCFCWANETWEGRWHGITQNNKVLISQNYGDKYEIENHFNYLTNFFLDERYIKIDNKPLFQIYRPPDLINNNQFVDIFNRKAIELGFDGIHFMGGQKTPLHYNGYLDSKISSSFAIALDSVKSKTRKLTDSFNNNKIVFKLLRGRFNIETLTKVKYDEFIKIMYDVHIHDLQSDLQIFPIVINDFDNTPRSGSKGVVFTNSTPDKFGVHVGQTLELVKNRTHNNYIFIKSWNEWAEGNYLEPDIKYGLSYLRSFQKEYFKYVQ
jgi:hypothetical protein